MAREQQRRSTDRDPVTSGLGEARRDGPSSTRRIRFGLTTVRLVWSVALFVVWTTACAGPGPDQLTEEEVQVAERDLLEPFRSRRTVLCDALEVELSPNFYDEVLTLPTASEHIDLRREPQPDGGTLYTYRNRVNNPMQLLIGNVDYRVWRSAVIRVPGGERVLARLQAAATGVVRVRDDEAAEPGFVEVPRFVLGLLPGEGPSALRATPSR